MKIKFIQNYQGRETAMQEKFIGDELDCGTAFALALIELGVAEEVEEIEGVDNQITSYPEPVNVKIIKKSKVSKETDQ